MAHDLRLMPGKLFIVATPIGNLEDITFRAVRTLKEADLVCAEDTRHTGLLLKHFEISRPMMSYHQFNEAQRRDELFQRFDQGQQIALVSDAGMPGVSDPGERLIRECVKRNVTVEVIPGPSAVLHGLVASGFGITPFYFGGFLPVKGAARQRELTAAAEREFTSVYFESPYRLLRTLEDCTTLFPERRCCVGRELTKKFEEVITALPPVLKEHFSKGKIRGEITFMIEGGDISHG